MHGGAAAAHAREVDHADDAPGDQCLRPGERDLAPAQQIVLLYEGAIRRIRRRAMRSSCAASLIAASPCQATAIIEGLQSCLDHARGGEIAQSGSHLHPCHLSPATINLTDDPAICDEIARLDQLRAAWASSREARRRRGTGQGDRRSRARGDHLNSAGASLTSALPHRLQR